MTETRLTPKRELEIRERWQHEELTADPIKHSSNLVSYDIVSGRGADANSVCECYTTEDRDRLISIPSDIRVLLLEIEALRADLATEQQQGSAASLEWSTLVDAANIRAAQAERERDALQQAFKRLENGVEILTAKLQLARLDAYFDAPADAEQGIEP